MSARSSPRVLVGILASNQKAKTLRCLDSLANSSFQDFDVFLVDNASVEGIGKTASAYRFVTVSEQDRNRGCAGGRNVVLNYFRSNGSWEYLFFLDNDAVVPEASLGLLVGAAEELRANGICLGGLGPHVAYYDRQDRLWAAGGSMIDWENAWFHGHGQGLATGSAFPVARRLDTLTGGFMLTVREAVLKTGPFVDDYFIYVEDTDWCWRMKKAGYELWSAPRALFLHDASSSVGKCSSRFHFLRIRNRLWFFQAYSDRSRIKTWCRVAASVWTHTIRMEAGSGNILGALSGACGLISGVFVPRAVSVMARELAGRKVVEGTGAQ